MLILAWASVGCSSPVAPPKPAAIPAAPTTLAVPAPTPASTITAPPETTAAPPPCTSAAAPAPSASADAGTPSPAFEVRVSLVDAGRDRESVLTLDGKPVKSLRELTRQLKVIAAKHPGLRVFFFSSSYGLASEEVEAAGQAVRNTGIKDIVYGVISLEPQD